MKRRPSGHICHCCHLPPATPHQCPPTSPTACATVCHLPPRNHDAIPPPPERDHRRPPSTKTTRKTCQECHVDDDRTMTRLSRLRLGSWPDLCLPCIDDDAKVCRRLPRPRLPLPLAGGDDDDGGAWLSRPHTKRGPPGLPVTDANDDGGARLSRPQPKRGPSGLPAVDADDDDSTRLSRPQRKRGLLRLPSPRPRLPPRPKRGW